MIELITGPQKATGDWYDTTLLSKARLHGEACPATPPTDESGLNSFILLQYYDLPLSLYTAYARTGDATFLTLARKCADAWWKHPAWIGEGKVRKWPDEASPPPRHAGIGGLICRALDGRPEMWDWINSYSTYFYHIYVKRRATGNLPLYDVREGAFTLRFITWLSKVLPDSFPNAAAIRAQHLADVELGVKYFGDRQRADGAWVWNDEFTDSDGGLLRGVTQPFIVGILLRALCDAHQVVSDSVKLSIKNQILNGCRHLYSDGPYVKDQIEQKSGKRIRGFHYLYHGGTTVNSTKYALGDMRFPWTAVEAWWLSSARQAISTIAGAFAYAFKISGDEFYRIAGNELWDSAYLGTDGIRAMMDDTAKNFNQHVWGSSNYQAWLQGVTTTPPLPSPPPAPTPTPTPTPQPTPEPSTPVVTITSHQNGAILTGNITVTATVTDKNVITSAHLVVDDVVVATVNTAPYNFPFDTKRLSDGAHLLYVRAWNSLGKAGDSAKLSVTVKNAAPVPTPTPEPEPVPQPAPVPCSMTVSPAELTLPINGVGAVTVNLLNMTAPTEVTAIPSSGQVTVNPGLKQVTGTSALIQFQVGVKRKGGNVTFKSGCGSKVVVVKVN